MLTLVGANIRPPRHMLPKAAWTHDQHLPRRDGLGETNLSRSVGSSSSNSGNSSNSSTGSPGLGGSLMSSVLSDGVRLSLVLGHGLVDRGNDIVSDGSGEDGGCTEEQRVRN